MEDIRIPNPPPSKDGGNGNKLVGFYTTSDIFITKK
jgi:hypothetical protein